MKTPVILVSGYLGSGKTTFLLHLLANIRQRIAIVMNEFGTIDVDGKVVRGKDVLVKELTGGCICCSLTGAFEEALAEIIANYAPELIIIETTGIAEPDAVILDLTDEFPQVSLESVVTIVDADVMTRFPSIDRTEKSQIASADLVIINKTDLVTREQVASVQIKVREINDRALLVTSHHCSIDPALISQRPHRRGPSQSKITEHDIQSFVFTPGFFGIEKLKQKLSALPSSVFRLKGFIKIGAATFLLNFVAGRHTLEETSSKQPPFLVCIGKKVLRDGKKIEALLGNT